MTEADAWRRLEAPPAGGLARLQAGIESRRYAPSRAWRTRGAWAGALVATFVISILLANSYREHTAQRAFADSLHAALARAEFQPVLESGIQRELPSSRADVRIVVINPRTGADAAPVRR